MVRGLFYVTPESLRLTKTKPMLEKLRSMGEPEGAVIPPTSVGGYTDPLGKFVRGNARLNKKCT